jgi:hypothetical protein
MKLRWQLDISFLEKALLHLSGMKVDLLGHLAVDMTKLIPSIGRNS